MAKADWNFFEFGAVSNVVQTTADATLNPSRVSPGGDQKSLELTVPAGWAGASPYPIFGYMYNGPDKNEFPLGEGQVSFAIRTSDNEHLRAGVIVRSQVDLNGGIVDPNDMNFYIFGTSSQTAGNHTGVFSISKVVNGVVSFFGGSVVENVVDNATDFCQIEIRLLDVGGQVEIYWRRNQGSQLTEPGDPGWTGFSLFATDGAPGVLANPGYWGFGILNQNSGSFSTEHIYNFDRIRITQEIIS